MRLKLSISSAQAASLADGACASFHLRGGTIGRGRDNDWVLPDAERVISTHHAVVHYESGQYYFEDTSSNGSFLNDPGTPMPRGQLVPLQHGDLIYIGDYEIQVECAEDALGARATPDLPGAPPLSPFASRSDHPLASMPTPSGDDWDYLNPRRDTLPSAAPPALDAWGASAPATRSDHVAADQHQFRPPTPIAEIIGEDNSAPASEILPENWWADEDAPLTERAADLLAATTAMAAPPGPLATERPPTAPLFQPVASPPPSPRTQVPAEIAPGSPASAQQQAMPEPTQESSSETNLLAAAFLEGLGVRPEVELSPAQMHELMHRAGRLLRLVTQATAEVLQARSALKSEFRLSQTILRPAENNPLKFSLNLDQTLRDLLLDARTGYLDPERAFAEAMTDIKHHEIAVMAGMRAAFECLIEKFSPETVENSLCARGKGGKALPLTDRTWHFYRDYFRTFKANAGDEFDGIFGQDFVRAYEEQVERLSARN